MVYRGNLGQQNHRGETLEMGGARGRRQTGIGERCREGASLDRLIHRRKVWRFKSLLSLGQGGRIQLDVVTVSTRIDEIRARVAVRTNTAGRLINTTRTESDLEIGVAIGSDAEHQRAHQRRPRSGENHHEGQRNDVHQVSVPIQVPVSFSTTAMPQSCRTTKVTPRGTHGQYESGSPGSSLQVVCDILKRHSSTKPVTSTRTRSSGSSVRAVFLESGLHFLDVRRLRGSVVTASASLLKHKDHKGPQRRPRSIAFEGGISVPERHPTS